MNSDCKTAGTHEAFCTQPLISFSNVGGPATSATNTGRTRTSGKNFLAARPSFQRCLQMFRYPAGWSRGHATLSVDGGATTRPPSSGPPATLPMGGARACPSVGRAPRHGLLMSDPSVFCTRVAVLSLPASAGLCVTQLFKRKQDSVALLRDLETSSVNHSE